MSLLLAVLLLVRPTPAPDPSQELIRLEQRLTEALVRSDVPAIDSLWSDDLIFIGTDGKASTKSQRLSQMKAVVTPSPATVTNATNEEIKVRLYGPTAVVTLLATWKGRANGRDFSDRYMTTHLWAKRRGQWRLVSAHVSRLAQ